MDSKTDMDKFMENMSFHVLVNPCYKNKEDDIPKNIAGTPINLRIKLRHKNDAHRGVISVPKLVFKTHKKLRLVSSDQTIMSINFLMDTENNKKIVKKTQKKIFHIFRPGVCLGTQSDDDDYPYMVNSQVNIKSTTNVAKTNYNKGNFGLKKNNTIIRPLEESIHPPKIFLGKCKPGGCLDPPFGEEKYVYEPVLIKSNDKINQRYLNQNELQKSALITYPSMSSCSELKVRNEKFDKSHKIKEELHISPPNTYAYLQSYYMPNRSKEVSISSYSENMENDKLLCKSKQIISSSKDSILTPTGCPAEPVLPTSVNLSPIQSNVTTLQNTDPDKTNYFGENIQKKDNGQFSSYNFYFNSDAGSDNISQTITPLSNTLPQSQILVEDTEISNKLMIKEHIQVISSTNKNEELSNLKAIGNILENSLEDGDKPNGVVEKHSIIIISPIKNSKDVNDCKKFVEPKFQNNIIKTSQTLSTDFIPINSDINLEVLQIKESQSISINKLNIHVSDTCVEKIHITNSSSLLKGNIIDILNGHESEISDNFNISHVKLPIAKLDKKINVVPVTTFSSVNERKSNVNSEASDPPFGTNQVPFQQSTLNIEEEKFIQDINIKNIKLPSITDSSQILSKSIELQSSGTTLCQLIPVAKMSSRSDTPKSNFEIPLQIYNKEPENVLFVNENRENIKSLGKRSSETYKVENKLIIQSESKEVLGDDIIESVFKTSLGSLNYDIPNDEISDIKYKKMEINSFENKILKNSLKSISSQSTFNLKKNSDINALQTSYTAFNKVYPNPLKKKEQASDKDLIKNNHHSNISVIENNGKLLDLMIENIEKKPESATTSFGSMNYDITNKIISETNRIEEVAGIQTFINRPPNNDNTSIQPSLKQSTLGLNKNYEKIIINRGIDPEKGTISHFSLSQTSFNELKYNSRKEDELNNKDIASNQQSKLSNIENINTLLELVTENEQEKAIKSQLFSNDDEMKIHIDSNTDIILQVRKKNHDKSEIRIKASFLNNKIYICDNKQQNTPLSSEGHNIDTISSIFERDLVLLETLLRALKEEVDILLQNQRIVKEILKLNKTLPARIVHANRQCACYQK